jgi:Rod binding domain-containing protein
MSDIAALPALSDPTLSGGGLSALSMKMGSSSANIDKVAQDFEAVFATQMLQPMFESIKVDETFGGGHGEEVMRSFMLQEYGKLIAHSGKLGIASKVKAEMLRAQEAADGKSSRSSGAGKSAKNPYAQQASQRLSMGGADVTVQ